MSAPTTGGGQASPARTAGVLLAQFVAMTALLFLTRFVARGHLVPEMDQECFIGGIAVDVLEHGIRFPIMTYAPNEYDNGSFFSGLLAAVSFTLFGRNVLALKLVTHLIAAAGAVAALWLLRSCLEELGVTKRGTRWLAASVLVIEIALAPRIVTMLSTYAVGNHTEGAAINTILLALFSRRLHTRSAGRTALFWALVGFALYLNKGTLLVLPVLALGEIALSWRAPARLAAAVAGLATGILPEMLVIAQRQGMGWSTMASKAERGSSNFPRAFFDSLLTISEYRIERLLLWPLTLCAGMALVARSLLDYRRRSPNPATRAGATSPPQGLAGALPTASLTAGPPIAVAMVVGVSWLHLVELSFMAKLGLDQYVIYGYPTLAVTFAVLAALLSTRIAERSGQGAGAGAAAAMIALALVLSRPDATSWGWGKVSSLWHNRSGAACSWRFAEGFMREREYGLAPPELSREQNAIQRCRLLSDTDQVLDCIGGIARELNWRQRGKVNGEPPSELSEIERRAYAYHYGTHRKGKLEACQDFNSADLRAECSAAAELECLMYGDIYTRLSAGHGVGRPRCNLPEPPMDTYWAGMRRTLLARQPGPGPSVARAWGDDDLRGCQEVFAKCF